MLLQLYDGFCLQGNLKNVSKHFRNFVGQNQRKRKWDEKLINELLATYFNKERVMVQVFL